MRKMITGVLAGLAVYSGAAYSQRAGTGDIEATSVENELSYASYIHSSKRIKCLYGYAAHKTGDHAAAIEIFTDCIRRWNDVFSMIGLAQLYDSGAGLEQDAAKSAALIKRAAYIHDDTSYPSLARYHYGVALAQGKGVEKNTAEARMWLSKAAAEGVKEAAHYLEAMDAAPQ